MPRYFFDIHDGIVAHDTEGTDLPTPDAARAHAMQVAAAYAGNPAMLGTDGGAIVVEVRDTTAKLVTVRIAFDILPA